jgi:hypothetical protein
MEYNIKGITELGISFFVFVLVLLEQNKTKDEDPVRNAETWIIYFL